MVKPTSLNCDLFNIAVRNNKKKLLTNEKFCFHILYLELQLFENSSDMQLFTIYYYLK